MKRNPNILTISFLVSVLLVTSYAVIDNTKVGTQCLSDRRNDLITIRMVIDTTGETINYILGCTLNPNGTFTLYDCDFRRENQFLIIEAQGSTLEGQQGFVPPGLNGCGMTAEEVNGDWEYTILVLARNERGLIQIGDVNLGVVCRESLATQQFVRSSIITVGDILVPIEPDTPTISLEVWGLDEGTNTMSRVDQCVAGQDLELRVVMNIFNYREFISPCGVETRGLLVSRTNDFTDAYEVIGQDSCTVTPNIVGLGIDGAFRITSQSSNQVIYSTQRFECVQFRKRDPTLGDEIWFYLSVKLCFGQNECDNRCGDFCQYNRDLLTGRRRRQTAHNDTSERYYRTKINVIVKETEEEGLSETMMVTITVVAAVVIIAVIIAIAVFCVCRNRSSGVKKYPDSNSQASSDHVLPVKY